MAFFHEPRGRQPFLRAPFVVIALIAVLAAVFAAYDLAPENLQDSLIYRFAFIPAGYSQTFYAAHPGLHATPFELVIPFVSYIFLHGSWEHLIVNCVWLLAFGPIVARRYGALPFLAFFFVCGIAGAATHLAFNWGSGAPVIGASAAIAGLMGAAFRMIGSGPMMLAGEGPLAPLLSSRIMTWSAVWVAINVVAGLMGLGAGSEVQIIAWQAHLGGYFAGLLFAGPFDRFHTGRQA